MRIASFTTLTLTAAATLLAIWSPIGTWWQWAITAFVLLLIGAGLGGASAQDTEHEQPADKAGSYNHVHVKGNGYTADEIVAEFEKRMDKNEMLYGETWRGKAGALSDKIKAAYEERFEKENETLKAMTDKNKTLSNNLRNDYGKKAQS